jgi:redox-sensitive bicupin YhaK (pirin superfamily)
MVFLSAPYSITMVWAVNLVRSCCWTTPRRINFHLATRSAVWADIRTKALKFSPINLWDVNLRAGKSIELPLPNGHTTTFLVLSGAVTANGEREAVEGDLAIFARNGDSITVEAKTDAKLLVMDGEPIDEPVVGQGPFE